ncbi:MAG: gliding motility-associated C-terminal domain-containing protein [Bacteroidales bacterium]|nr:gliding motility-associated C-terminal domain-containing protein [Bacteroidales bacterium]
MRISIHITIISFLIFFTQNIAAQTYKINDYSGQTVTTCTGTFTDMGGTGAGYSGTQNDQITFCPGTVGAAVQLDFTQFDMAAGDAIELYDGQNTTANLLATFNNSLSPVGMLISASILNPTGCLTFVLGSSGSAPGWEAAISCGLPCQNYSVEILSSLPPFHLDTGYYYIDVCPGDSVSITATGNYGLNDSIYHQSDATSEFIWDMGNYHYDTTQTVETYYDSIGGYNVLVVAIDSNGCLANQVPKIRVRISTQPELSTFPISDPVCQYDTTSLFGHGEAFQWHVSSSLNEAGLTYLPDGSGVSYTSSLLFTVFDATATITSPVDILAIKATLEHSYLGDLDIRLTCPSGQFSTLKSYPGGGSTFLGEPIDNNSAQVPGIGYEYAWMPNGSTTMLNAVGNYTYSYTNALGLAVTNSYLPPSTGYPANATITGGLPLVDYLPEDPFNVFIGCPLNGLWEITITDNLGIDNGFIFAWGIDFTPSLLPDSWDYIPEIASESWNYTTDIVIDSGAHVVISPQHYGPQDYTFTVMDEYGCIYDTLLTIDVIATPNVDLGNDTVLCMTSMTDVVVFDATDSIPGVDYLWSSGNTAATNVTNTSGDLWVEVTNNVGNLSCSNRDTIHLDAYEMATLELGNDTCYMTDEYVLYAGNRGHNPPFLFLWNDGSTGDSILITQSGTYSVTIAIDPNSPCLVDDEIKISLFSKNFLGDDLDFCDFEEILISVPEDTISHEYTWLLDGSSPIIDNGSYFSQKYLEIGDHILSLNIDNGCYDEVKLTSKDCKLEIPNVITPNGDGYNDVFIIDGIENYPNSILSIYNRWGKKVYESNNYTNDWDGENITDGVYYFHLITTVGDKETEYKGSLTVIR